MLWITPSARLIFLLMCLQGCGIYLFSGMSLPSKAKTISLAFQSTVALGPPDLVEKFQQQLGDELVQCTPLKRVSSEGDLQLEGVIRHYEYVSMAPTKKDEKDEVAIDRLTIEVQMNYINPYNKEVTFSKKIFSQYADASAHTSRTDEEPQLIDEIITKLVKDIFNATVAAW